MVAYQHITEHAPEGAAGSAVPKNGAMPQKGGGPKEGAVPEIDVAIIGGGASGLACAAALSQALSGVPGRIVLFEASKRVGTPILRSGNGRCNFSNVNAGPEAYFHSSFVARTFEALGESCASSEVRNWLASLGLYASPAFADGALYPFSNKASSVLDVLRLAIDDQLVEIKLVCPVVSVVPDAARYELTTGDGACYRARFVVYATGGNPSPAPQIAGLAEYARHPLLLPLKLANPPKWLDGVRVKAQLSLPAHQIVEAGEVLFREYGISGIAVFNLSRFARKGDEVRLDLMPDMSEEQLVELLQTRMEGMLRVVPAITGRVTNDATPHAAHDVAATDAERLLVGLFVPGIARLVLEQAGVASLTSNSGDFLDSLRRIAHAIKQVCFTVTGLAKHVPQVWRGGVDVAQMNPSTLEATHLPGLFVTGEALDVDGPCGGYNLHWAWTCGLLAGRTIAGRLVSEQAEQKRGSAC